MQEREYIVTLHRFEDLDSFYDDMESSGGNLYIPNRAVQVFDRRPISRNTHYLLTDDEAAQVANDPRVMSVELNFKDRGLTIEPQYSQFSNNWDKSWNITSLHKNWGLLRVIRGSNISNWGSNGTSNVSSTINIGASGKNVDVVIVDGHINPAHPEFARNPDGTGGSRVNQFNWFSLNPQVTGGAPGNYIYTPYVSGTTPLTTDNDHGSHVAGTVAGNTQGWAKDANIYNISPYSSNPNLSVPLGVRWMDYIREWHKQKPVNPVTGVKNPTITNNSYAFVSRINIASITGLYYRGLYRPGPFDEPTLKTYGIYNTGGSTETLSRNNAVEQDFIDCINDGIIVIGSAGNSFTKISNYTSPANSSDDYNNYYITALDNYYYNRGGISAADKVVCVGAASNLTDERKADFSNSGPRITVYAPGVAIMSSIGSTIQPNVNDSRNTLFKITKYQGTSMASPQVAGVIACLAESNPRINQDQVLDYLKRFSTKGQIADTKGGILDYTDLQGSDNNYLYFVPQRPSAGNTYPKQNQGNRPVTGMMYPRPKIYRYGR